MSAYIHSSFQINESYGSCLRKYVDDKQLYSFIRDVGDDYSIIAYRIFFIIKSVLIRKR